MRRSKQPLLAKKDWPWTVGWQFYFVLMVFLLIGVWTWFRRQSLPIFFDQGAKLPQHDRIQVYFNHNPLSEYEDPYRGHQRPGDNLEQMIVEQIESAQSRIDVAVQELRSPLIAKALRDRHRAGVKVRVILENTYSRAWSDYSADEVDALDDRLRARYRENRQLIDHNQDQSISPQEAANYDAVKILDEARIPRLDDTADGSQGSGLVHHKFVILDQQTVVTTSANFTLSDLHGDIHIPASQGNANSLLVLRSEEVAQAFQQEFELLWGDGPGGQSDSRFGVNKPRRDAQQFTLGDAQLWLKFSPDSASIPWAQTSNGFIDQQLAASRDQVNLALFVFSDQQLANQLAIAHKNGVEVKALIDRSFAYRPFSEGLDMLGVALPQENGEDPTDRCHTEDLNQPWPQPIRTVGTPKLASGDLLHHKFGVIDQSVVVVGSHNWSAAANRLNDETVIAIEHPMVAAHYQQEFERLYTNSRLGLPDRIEDQWQDFQSQCANRALAPDNLDEAHSETSNLDSARINLNSATQEELESLPGIGEKTAQAIIDARAVDPIDSWEDVDAIPGIGAKTVEKLRDRVTW